MPPGRPSYRAACSFYPGRPLHAGQRGSDDIGGDGRDNRDFHSAVHSRTRGLSPPERRRFAGGPGRTRVPPLIPHELTGAGASATSARLGGIRPGARDHPGPSDRIMREYANKPAPAPKAGKAVETKAAAGTPAPFRTRLRETHSKTVQCTSPKLKPSPKTTQLFPPALPGCSPGRSLEAITEKHLKSLTEFAQDRGIRGQVFQQQGTGLDTPDSPAYNRANSVRR